MRVYILKVFINSELNNWILQFQSFCGDDLAKTTRFTKLAIFRDYVAKTTENTDSSQFSFKLTQNNYN